MTTNLHDPPIAEYGCIDCVPSDQADLLFYFIVFSPFLFTLIVSYFFVPRAQVPIGILNLMAISVPGALPAAIGLALAFEDDVTSAVTTATVAAFIWAATFGPFIVFFMQWIYLEIQSISKRSSK